MSKVALITGASGGIGGAIARTLAEQGYRLALGWHTGKAAAEALCAEMESRKTPALALQADVRSEEGVEALFAGAEEQLGPVTVLVNNAGIAQSKQFQDITLAEWNGMLGTHATGAFLCSRRALPGMLRQKQGCIINISSIWGQVGASCEVHYSAAKAALIGMTKALAKEVAPSGVRVNCVAPGVIETGMLASFSEGEIEDLCDEIPLGSLGTAQQVADAVAFFASERAAYITGQVLGVNGGMAL